MIMNKETETRFQFDERVFRATVSHTDKLYVCIYMPSVISCQRHMATTELVDRVPQWTIEWPM